MTFDLLAVQVLNIMIFSGITIMIENGATFRSSAIVHLVFGFYETYLVTLTFDLLTLK